jgi:lysophospholipid acyltransferase (LPLAT)-like uncharacterized protein
VRRVVSLGARSLRLTLRGEHELEMLLDSERPAIYLYWHHQLLLSARFVLDRLVRAERPLTVMISPSRDGDLATGVVEKWGLRVHRGSASRGGQRALRALYREITRAHSSILMLPDGPRGPALVVKPGAIVLAQMAAVPIVPLGLSASRAIALGSWDRMLLPLPFSRLGVVVGEPVEVPRQLDDERREALQRHLEAELQRLSAQARDLVDPH